MRERSPRPHADAPPTRHAPRQRRPGAGPLHDELSWRRSSADADATIRRRCAPCADEDEQLRREAHPRPIEGLQVGAAGDPLESAADALAARALAPERAPIPAAARARATRVEAPAALAQRLGSGAPLEDDVRGRMEAGFGSDFGSVRVHVGPSADDLSRRLSARAFTVGQEVAFAAGQYRPGTPDGDRLLAHELAHTLQPRPGQAPAARRQPDDGEELDESAEEDAREDVEASSAELLGGATLALFGCNPGDGKDLAKDGGPTAGRTTPPTPDAGSDADKKKDDEKKKDAEKTKDQPVKEGDAWKFPTKPSLDVRKDAWKVKIRELFDASEKAAGASGTTDPLTNDLIRWLMGDPSETDESQKSNPVADKVTLDGKSVNEEVSAQKKALATAMIAAKLPNLPKTVAGVIGSEYRNYAAQASIWGKKWAFTRSNFDVVSTTAAAKCGDPDVIAGEKWNPPLPDKPSSKPKDEKDKAAMAKWKSASDKRAAAEKKVKAQAGCWNLDGKNAKGLDQAERAKEILQASSAPGVSRHHWGTDFDFWSVAPEDWKGTGKVDLSKVYDWLKPNASTFGFMQSFVDKPAGASAPDAYGTRYFEERWHWSYYPVAQALLEVSQQADVRKKLDAALKAKWAGTAGGTLPDKFDYVSKHWTSYMDDVNRKP